MPEPLIPASLIDAWVERSGLPWSRVVLAIGLVLILFLVGAAYLDGVLTGPFDSGFWRLRLGGPILVVYIYLAYRPLRRSIEGAIGALRLLLTMEDDEAEQALDTASLYDRRGEWLALAIGAAFGLLVTQPWRNVPADSPWHLPAHAFWLVAHDSLTTALLFGSMGWVAQRLLVYTRLITELQRQPLAFDVFDPTSLEPVAHFGLVTALTFIGGTTLSVLLLYPGPQALMSIETLIIYSALIPVPILAFFLIMADTHRVMAAAKQRELKQVRNNLAAEYQELKVRAADGRIQDMEALSDSIVAWLAYEKRIEESPEWPYTADILRNIVLSTLLPIGAWIAQIVVEFITRSHLSPPHT